MLFMKPGTAICLALGDKLTWPEISHSQIQSIHISIFAIFGMIHFGSGQNPVNMSIEIGLDALKRAIFAQEHGFFG